MAEDRNGFWLLAAGALLFAAVYLIGLEWLKLDEKWPGLDPGILVGLCTVAFGLPYALRELRRQTNWLLVAYLLILIPLLHFLAAYLLLYVSNSMSEAAAEAAAAAEMAETAQMAPMDPASFIKLVAGLAAGFVGAFGLLLAPALLRWLRAPGASPLVFIAALLALTWWGGMGMRLVGADMDGDYSAYVVVVLVFLPWQMLLAFFLSHLLKASPPKASAPAAP